MISFLTVACAGASAHSSEGPKSAEASAKDTTTSEPPEDTSTL